MDASSRLPRGNDLDLCGAPMLRISDIHDMPPFLVSVVSDGDLWMYASTRGGLSCGRRRPEDCLFPYETDDRLHRASGLVGPFTLLRCRGPQGERWWQPFDPVQPAGRQNLYKTELGNRAIFEEINDELGLVFRWTWANAGPWGFVRRAHLERTTNSSIESIDLLDGLLHVMPSGVALTTQQRASALVNAYRRTESFDRLTVFRLSSLIVDKAEPAEALRANVVWSRGLPDARLLVSTRQLDGFRRGEQVDAESACRGIPGSYLLSTSVALERGESMEWDIVADVARSQADAVKLRSSASDPDIKASLEADVRRGDEVLGQLLAGADSVQKTGRPVDDAHHLANVLFNCMRGGVPVDGYGSSRPDMQAFAEQRNPRLFEKHRSFFDQLPDELDCARLWDDALSLDDPQLTRLCLEYLPIGFSRRHGDPSRPWNAFDISVRERDGGWKRWYQGNWRDIFQNWEALIVSHPALVFPVIAKFVNASTTDGFNPYRISREGIDWEVPDPEDPWSNIGYWGDHQIVYLTRLLELAEAFDPGKLQDWLTRPVFAYADVPYRLKSYDEIVADPRDTIEFDEAKQKLSEEREQRVGSDGRLLLNEREEVILVGLAEKLLIPILSKLSNFCPGGGVWMNTQRPEWNDANNALAGFGLSMVTTYQLRRHLEVCERLFEKVPAETEILMSREVAQWFSEVQRVLESIEPSTGVDDVERRRFLDEMGRAFERYRFRVNEIGLQSGGSCRPQSLRALLSRARAVIDASIRANRRPDGLYHAYNVIDLRGGEAKVAPLYEMLEGQMAVLGAGVLSPEESVEVIDALFASKMYRSDQKSFMLYPDRRLPGFFDKNTVPGQAEKNPLVASLLNREQFQILEKDAQGALRFGADLRNEEALHEALDDLAQRGEWSDLVQAHRGELAELWEQVFNHREFTGRSGTMYGYEGLGCIYWHMVSKLLLSVQESLVRAREEQAPPERIAGLVQRYFQVRNGLGPAKTPREFGAVPTDPYSHTPGHAGAQQPGMTGQVKEEIMTRYGELGVRVRAGKLSFEPFLLAEPDFLSASAGVDVPGRGRIELEPGQLLFTLAGVPVVYTLVDGPSALTLREVSGVHRTLSGAEVPEADARRLFGRDGSLERIDVEIPRRALRA
ncbi:MAG: hypothetical protein AAGD10_16220 [Myxococcota bacterium]